MKQFIKHTMYGAAFLCAVSTSPAWAQIVVPIQATIQNTVTVAVTQDMDFGTVVAIPGPTPSAPNTNTSVFTLSTNNSVTPTANGAAAAAVIDSSTAQAAEVTITGAADGAPLTVNIANIIGPNNSGEAFTLGSFVQRINGAASQTAVVSDTFTFNYDDNGGAGSVILLGATLNSASQASFTQTTPYTGSFDVVVSY